MERRAERDWKKRRLYRTHEPRLDFPLPVWTRGHSLFTHNPTFSSILNLSQVGKGNKLILVVLFLPILPGRRHLFVTKDVLVFVSWIMGEEEHSPSEGVQEAIGSTSINSDQENNDRRTI